MSFYEENNPCPCESGIEFDDCCNIEDQLTLNVIAEFLSEDEIDNLNVTDEIKKSLHQFSEPDMFPVSIDLYNDNVQLVKMSPFWFNESTFLDNQRIRGRTTINATLPWLLNKMTQFDAQLTSHPACPYIFHSAFCGSTMMSKALEILYECLPLREPNIVSRLSNFILSDRCDTDIQSQSIALIHNVLNRRFDESQTPVIKVNDNANSLMNELHQWQSSIPILFMYTSLDDFLAGCLKLRIRKDWIKERYHYVCRLSSSPIKIPRDIPDDDYAQMAAIYWSYNIACYLQTRDTNSNNIHCLVFNNLLASPLKAVQLTAKYFKLTALPGVFPENELKWLLSVHAKDTLLEYSPQIRQDEIEAILKQHTNELAHAKNIAQELLKEKYPTPYLPGELLE